MPAKVFISCGQRSDDEKAIADEVRAWFKEQGFEAYVAAEVQDLTDLAESVKNQLQTSDYFLFIDFCREDLSRNGEPTCRGSLFSHQELALAYYLEFEDSIIYLQDQNRTLEREGILKWLHVNPIPVGGQKRPPTRDEVVKAVADAVTKRKWAPSFSRLLVPRMGEKPSTLVTYRDHTTTHLHPPERKVYIWGVKVSNERRDRAALNVTATLRELYKGYAPPYCPDNAWLKWAGHWEAYSMVIPPNDHRSFDALAFEGSPPRVLLNSRFDVLALDPATGTLSRRPIIEAQGTYYLKYRIDAIGFPAREFYVELRLESDFANTYARTLSEAEQREFESRAVDHRP